MNKPGVNNTVVKVLCRTAMSVEKFNPKAASDTTEVAGSED